MRKKSLKRQPACNILTMFLCMYLFVLVSRLRLMQTELEIDFVNLDKKRPPQRMVPYVSCRKLIEGDKEEQELALNYTKSHPLPILSDKDMLILSRNCSRLKDLGYRLTPATREEAEFPIAFSILLHQNVSQAEKLLRLIYHPQNYYCIHIDHKANPDVIAAMEAIASCFPNVYIASKLEDIVYAGFARLQAEITCMADMLKAGSNWKYYINLVSSVLPLRTNREIVEILKIFNGANDIEGIIGRRIIKSRFSHVLKTINGKLVRTHIEKGVPPHGIKIVRGSAYGTFSRGFVDFIINDQRAKDLLEWSNDTYSPDEHYWATLHHLGENPHLNTPGGYHGKADGKIWLSAYASWGSPCFSGITRHGICIFGIRDLPSLMTRKELFANKFDFGVQYLAAACLEEYLHNKTVFDLPMSDRFYYSQLPFINKTT